MNALYLIRLDLNDPDKVLKWVEMAEIQTVRMGKILEQESIRQTPLE